MRLRSIPVFFVVIVALLAGRAMAADTRQQIDALLDGPEPFGVVFEIVESDPAALQWAIPAVKAYVQQLRQRYPELTLAVVTHGTEQFTLLQDSAPRFPAIHEGVRNLVDADVPVHVCGTHAAWRGKDAADFPDYVAVAPAGPAEIRHYQAMGYELVVVQRP